MLTNDIVSFEQLGPDLEHFNPDSICTWLSIFFFYGTKWRALSISKPLYLIVTGILPYFRDCGLTDVISLNN